MIIIHKIEDFLFNLFPKAKVGDKDHAQLKEEIANYYSFGPYKPKVEIENDLIFIEIDTSAISNQKMEFDIVVRYCESGKFKKAKPILEKLITKNPTVSEYHRILGQIYSEEGSQEEAINHLIDSLRWDPKNTHALTMMGNIFGKYKNDFVTANSYYEHVLDVKPDDHIAMNNIGANLIQLGQVKEAERYFEKALSINNTYPNTLYALGMVNDIKGDYLTAFDFAIRALKICKPGNPIYSNAFELVSQVSFKAIKSIDPMEMFNQYSQILAEASGKVIDIVEDDTVPTPAKLEIAENYGRDKHVIRYKRDRVAGAHLMMHELVHLDLTVRCRNKTANFLFVTTKEHKELFIRDNEAIIQRLNREGLDDKSISEYITALFSGINSQIYNTPVDLFIEDFLFNSYPKLRPFEFLSLLSLLKEYIDAARSKKVIEYAPLNIRTANVILSLVHCFQFRDLFGYDMEHLFKANPKQIKIAKEFYNDYLQFKKNDKATEAHHLIQKWAIVLNMEKYFSLIEENEYRLSKTTTENIEQGTEHVMEAEASPAHTEQVDFAGEPAGQAAVTMYCLSALQYFEGMGLPEIQQCGFEIGLLGTEGIDSRDHNKKYTLKSIPDKEFTGLQLLSYMYVAFQHIDPSLNTGLNFKQEFQAAKEIYEKENRDTRNN